MFKASFIRCLLHTIPSPRKGGRNKTAPTWGGGQHLWMFGGLGVAFKLGPEVCHEFGESRAKMRKVMLCYTTIHASIHLQTYIRTCIHTYTDDLKP